MVTCTENVVLLRSMCRFMDIRFYEHQFISVVHNPRRVYTQLKFHSLILLFLHVWRS